VYLALDLGAESGRVVAGAFDGRKLVLDEIHRFPNAPVQVQGTIYWDVLSLFAEIKRGLSIAAKKEGTALASLGVDTWGVDYGLVDVQGRLLSNPCHYRDKRTDGMMDEAFRRVPKKEIYAHTGIQFMFFNTIYQVLSEVVHQTPALAGSHQLLFMPDLINCWLTGRKVNERTIASTSQMYDPNLRTWAQPMLEQLGIPACILGEIVPPGTVLGSLLPEVAEETGAGALSVVAPGCHDTASAVAAVPTEGSRSAYLSSGTWSLMGAESPKPIITDRSFEYGFTNEIGVCDTVRVLKNISGLWLVQECRRTWAARGEDLDYGELTRLAEKAPPFSAVVDPDHAPFAKTGDMPARIAEFCSLTGQKPPADKGAVVRTALEGLAFRYRSVLTRLEELVGGRLEPLHIVGGGANALNRPVIAGPVEATSAGNILMQMIGTGDLASLNEGRELIRRSFGTERYEPVDSKAWNEAYQRFREIEGK
jgi:sugar (pentulose or hexulose) kinase